MVYMALIYLLVIMVIAVVGGSNLMARHRRRRNFGNYINGQIDVDLGLGTLAAKTLVSATFSESVVDTTRISSIVCTHTVSDFTPGANIGPIIFGVAHSDYTDAEIEQWVEDAGSWDIGNKIAKEIRSRLVRQIGVFDDPASATVSTRINDGKPVRTKLNWLLAEGDTLKFWVYNTGNAAVATTVPNYHAFGKANLWQK